MLIRCFGDTQFTSEWVCDNRHDFFSHSGARGELAEGVIVCGGFSWSLRSRWLLQRIETPRMLRVGYYGYMTIHPKSYPLDITFESIIYKEDVTFVAPLDDS